MSEDKDVLSDDAWDDVPGAEPKPSDSTKTAEAAKPSSEPPKPASNPPRPASSSPPKPGSNPPRPAASSSSIPIRTASDSNPARATASTRPDGAAARGGTLIGIPAPSVVDASQEKPAEKPSDKPPETPADKPLHTASVVPAGKRTLIGIAAPVIEKKASPSEPPKAEAASGSKPPPAASSSPPPAASSSPPGATATAESLADTRRDRASKAPTEEEYRVSRAKSALASTRKETPEALASAKRRARDRAESDAPEKKGSNLGTILLFLAAAGAAAWFVFTKQRGGNEATNEPAQNPPADVARTEPEKAAEQPAPPPVITTPEPTAAAPASAAAAEPAPSAVASAEPIPTVSADDLPSAEPVAGKKGKKAPPASAAAQAPAAAAPTAAAPSAEGTRVVMVTLMPPDARLFYKGKSVGKSPVRIELAPGEKKRSFEVGRPGYVTRRLVVDGSQPEVSIGLRPESGAPPE